MKAQIPIFVNLYRGCAAIVLGILLLFIPNASRDLLFNLMGFFWLAVGFTVLRHIQEDERNPGKRTSIVGGIIGMVAGLLVVTRHLTRNWIDRDVIFIVLGTVVLATGVLHMFGEYRLGNITSDRRTKAHFLLGLFEVILGALLLLTRESDTPLLYWTATAWALIYGGLYVGMAVGLLIKSRQEGQH